MATLRIWNETHRIHAHDGGNYMDISTSNGYGDLQVELGFHQIAQIRKKSGRFQLFQFKSQEWIDDFDFGWWADAEVVWRSDK